MHLRQRKPSHSIGDQSCSSMIQNLKGDTVLQSELVIYERPLPATFEDVEDAELEVFFALGIVNPRGPTLTYLAAVGSPSYGVSRQVVFVMLNPFKQIIEQVGRFTIGEDFNPGLLDPFYKMTFGSCPTLILLDKYSDEAQRLRLATRLLTNFDEVNVDLTCAYVESFFGDPWRRVSKEMEGWLSDGGKASAFSAKRLSALAMQSEHIWPEIEALLFSWKGSIEMTGIDEALKRTAFPYARFQAHFWERLLPSLWLPEPPDAAKAPPEVVSHERFVAKSVEELRESLTKESWDDFGLDKLADLLRSSIILYGLEIEMDDIPHISRLYKSALQRGMDVDTRRMIEVDVFHVLEERRIPPVVFLPFLVHDPDASVASMAAIDFVSESPYVDGELYAVRELRTLFKSESLANRGAVFGGIVAIGDAELEPFLEEVRGLLSPDEIVQATRPHSHFLKHFTIQLCLRYCEELVDQKDEASQRNFGSWASALALCLQYDQTKIVRDAKRNFPCAGSAQPITILKTWPLREYAELIAPRLYALEAAEKAPRLFSDVLRAWGLEPSAPLAEQCIPDRDPSGRPTVPLRDFSASKLSDGESPKTKKQNYMPGSTEPPSH